ncbi:type VII secretion protein EssB/YukC [Streptococcus equi]|uniref:type VII secretion protein EssB/YukC n=1 Tax=Streptococcus equi TaxID=1336 RepID=UPI001E376B3E
MAYSVIMTEPLTDKQKEELSKISNQSNEDYLRYWVLIGQAKIDDAMDIASYLDDPQLLMYGLTKKMMMFREILI